MIWIRQICGREGFDYNDPNISDFGRQLNLFDRTDYEKLAKLDRTVDGLRGRFGTDAVMRAAFLGQPIDHMSGGISREKRAVDYDRVTVR